jgi:hypothetical protein
VVILIRVLATPNVYLVADSITGRLIITGDVSALNAGFGGTWVPVVSPGFLFRDAFTNPIPSRSGLSFRHELLEPVFQAVDTTTYC